MLLERFGWEEEPAQLNLKIWRAMNSSIEKGDDSLDDTMEKNRDIVTKALRMHEFEKHIALAESVPEYLRTMTMKICKDLSKEYNCTTVAEKALAEIVAMNFARTMFFSQKLSKLMVGEVSVDEVWIKYYTFVSKELDKAQRQYTTALTTLQQLKSPTLKVNLKAETAFIADKQQINAGSGDTSKSTIIDVDDEINTA